LTETSQREKNMLSTGCRLSSCEQVGRRNLKMFVFLQILAVTSGSLYFLTARLFSKRHYLLRYQLLFKAEL